MLQMGSSCLLNKIFSSSSEIYYREPGLYPFLPDIVETMTTLNQAQYNHSESWVIIKVSQKIEKLYICLANEGSVLACFCFFTELPHIFKIIVGNEYGALLRGAGPHKPDFAHDVFRIHCIMIYKNLIEYNIVCDTKFHLLRCFRFVSKLKVGNIMTAWQYKNYQTYCSLQFRPLVRSFFIVLKLTWETQFSEKHRLYL